MSIDTIALEFYGKYEGLAVLNFGYSDLNAKDDKTYVGIYLQMKKEELTDANTKTIVLNFTELKCYSSAIGGIISSVSNFCKDSDNKYSLACLGKVDNRWEKMHGMLNLDKIAKVYYNFEDIPVSE